MRAANPGPQASPAQGSGQRARFSLLLGRAYRSTDLHELSLMESVVEAVRSAIGGARVHRVRLVVGQDAGASPRALRFCFDVCARGTALEGAALEIVEAQGVELRLEEVEVS